MSAAELTRSVWDVNADDYSADAPFGERLRFLLRYAILAPSSHNSQPWRFRIEGRAVHVAADESRWLRAADPDRRELFVSLGCAVENLVVAAEHFGFDPAVSYPDGGTERIATVTMDDGASERRPAAPFDELTARYTSHERFDGTPLDSPTRNRLVAAVEGAPVALHLVNGDAKRAVGELQAEADRLQMKNRAYREELGHWIGLGALGHSWLLARVGQAVVAHLDIGDREAAKNSVLVESAPVVGVLTTASDDPAARVGTGRAFERVALRASAAGVAVHPMSQILERPALRRRLASELDFDGATPQHLFRLGYADEAAEDTPRWPVESVLDGE
ncbi:nitroreductase [Haloplanus rubicundus]|uniref:Nitroreductase n=1 Tax=Haloplanus rubicundus TaxID=1547898 RepID=A0A345DZG2_9EURY|nr:nitroreductase [Haloplanus rubicundus]AXG05334.1 nitroreductase [Haloplanus rubicundus]